VTSRGAGGEEGAGCGCGVGTCCPANVGPGGCEGCCGAVEMPEGSAGRSGTGILFPEPVDAGGVGLKPVLDGAKAGEETSDLRKSKRTRTFPPTPMPANVVPPPPPDPSVMPNSRPSTLKTASSPFLPNTTSLPSDSCSKCKSTSVRVAVGGKVPVRRIGGSEHCKAKVIGFMACPTSEYVKKNIRLLRTFGRIDFVDIEFRASSKICKTNWKRQVNVVLPVPI